MEFSKLLMLMKENSEQPEQLGAVQHGCRSRGQHMGR